jgi:hypothetical protein
VARETPTVRAIEATVWVLATYIWRAAASFSAIIAQLMERIGAVQRRQREAGSWIIDEQPLEEGH